MAKSFFLPDGTEITGIPDSASDEDILRRAIRRFPQLYPDEVKKEKGFFPSLNRSTAQAIRDAAPTAGAAAEAWGLDRIGKWLQEGEHQQPIVERARLRDFFDEPRQFLGETLGSALGSTAVPAAGGIAGALIGSRFGPSGTAMGGFGGAATGAVPLNTGDLYKQLLEEGVPRERAGQLARYWGAVISVPDVMALGYMAKPFLKGPQKETIAELASRLAKEEGVKGTAKAVGKGVSTRAGAEGLTELGQQGIQEAVAASASGTPFATFDRAERIAEAGIGGTMLGGTFGGLGGYGRLRGERRQVEDWKAKADAEGKGLAQFMEQHRQQLGRDQQERDIGQFFPSDPGVMEESRNRQFLNSQQAELFPTAPAEIAALKEGQPDQGQLNLFGAPVPFGSAQSAPAPQPAPVDRGDEARARFLKTIGVPTPEEEQKATIDSLTPKLPKHLAMLAEQVEPVKKEKATKPEPNVPERVITDLFKQAHETVRPGIKIKKAQYRNLRPLFEDAESLEEVIQNVAAAAAKPAKTDDQLVRQEIMGQFLERLQAHAGQKGDQNVAAGTPVTQRGGDQSGVGSAVQPDAAPVQVAAPQSGAVGDTGGTPVEDAGRESQADAALAEITKEQIEAAAAKKQFWQYLQERKLDPATLKPGTPEIEQIRRDWIRDTLGQEVAAPAPAPAIPTAAAKADVQKQEAAKKDQDTIDRATSAPATEEEKAFAHYFHTYGSMADALEELAYHRVWGMDETQGDTTEPGFAGRAPAKRAERWIRKNLGPEHQAKLDSLIAVEENQKGALKREASARSKETKDRQETGVKQFPDINDIVNRAMGRRMKAKLSAAKQMLENARNLIRAKDEDGARDRIDAFVERQGEDGLKTLQEVWGVESRDELADKLFDIASNERKKTGTDEGPSGTLLMRPASPNTLKFLREGNLNKALENILYHTADPKARELIQRLLDMRLNTKVTMYDKGPLDGVGSYNWISDRIMFNEAARLFGGLTDHVILHETTHAATAMILRNPERLRGRERAAMEEFRRIYKQLMHSRTFRETYAAKNILEFAAEIFSNPKLQLHLQGFSKEISLRALAARELDTVVVNRGQGALAAARLIWDRIVRVISDLLGFGTDLRDRSIQLVSSFMTHPDTMAVADRLRRARDLGEPVDSADPLTLLEQLVGGQPKINEKIMDMVGRGDPKAGDLWALNRDFEENLDLFKNNRDVYQSIMQAVGSTDVDAAMKYANEKKAGQSLAMLLSRLQKYQPLLDLLGPVHGSDNYAAVLSQYPESNVPTEKQTSVVKSLTDYFKGGMFRNYWVNASATAGNTEMERMGNRIVNDLTGEVSGFIKEGQALNYRQLVHGAAIKGGIELKDNGLFQTVDKPYSFKKMMELVSDFGKSLGSDEDARNIIQRAFVAKRADGMQKYVEMLAQAADVAERNGERDKAAKIRESAEEIEKKLRGQTPAQVAHNMQLWQMFPKELDAIHDMWGKIKNDTIDLLVKAGRLTPEAGDKLQDRMDYVPWYRVDDELRTHVDHNYGGLLDKKPVHTMKGSEEQIDDVIENMHAFHAVGIASAMKNHARASFLPHVAKLDAQGQPKKYDYNPKSDLAVPVYEKGKQVWYEVENAADVNAFIGLEPAAGPILDAFNTASRALRRATTSMPSFILTQIAKDMQRVALESGVKHPVEAALRIPALFIKMIGSELTGKGIDSVEKLKSYGTIGQYDFVPGHKMSDYIAKEIGVRKRTVMDRIAKALDKLPTISDAAPRAAVYEQTLAEGGSEALAASRAQELIHFGRQGSGAGAHYLRQIVPFMGGYMSGMDILYRSAMGRGISNQDRKTARNMFLGMVGRLAALATLYTMLIGDDEEYAKANDSEKLRNWFIPGTGLRIPVPMDVGIVYKAIPEITMNYIFDQGTDKPWDTRRAIRLGVESVLGSYSPPVELAMTPQLIRPTLEVLINHSFFTDRPIVGEGIKNRASGEQYTATTSEFAKMLGQQVGLSPVKVDHLMRGYFGIAASNMLGVTNTIARSMMENAPPDARWHENGFLRVFTSPFVAAERDRGGAELYYDLRDKVVQISNTVKHLRDTGRHEEAAAYNKKYQDLLKHHPRVMNIENQLEKMRQWETQIRSNKNLSGEQKRRLMDQLEKGRMVLYKGVEKMREAMPVL